MTMKNRKYISLFLVILMVFSLLPMQTMQAEEIIKTDKDLIVHYDMSKADGYLIDVTDNGFDAEYVGFNDEDFIEELGETILNFAGDKSKYVKLPKGIIEDETFTIETTFTSASANHWLYTLGTKEDEWPNVNNYVFFNPKQGDGTVRFGIKDSETEKLFQGATINPSEYSTFTATFEEELISLY